MTYPNAGLTRGFNADLATLAKPCDVEGCNRVATHCFARGYRAGRPRTFVPFDRDQRSVAGPMVCEIDAILIETDIRLNEGPSELRPNSDPRAPRWEDTIPLKRGR